MLRIARADSAVDHSGAVLQIERSRFAPADADLEALRAGTLDRYGFAVAYRKHLRRLWREDRTLFLDLLEQAKTMDVTLVDGWPDEAASPRLVLSDVLRVLQAQLPGISGRGLYTGAAENGRAAP